MESRPLDKKELALFEYIFSMRPESLHQALEEYLLTMYPEEKVHTEAMYLYAEGDIPIMLIAHLDTVFVTPPSSEIIFYDSVKNVMWSPVGLGADDRAGVIGILKLLNRGYRPHVLFTQYEESGGIGASQVTHKMKEAPDINFIIELDRRGTNDAVFYNCYNQDFIDYIEQFGFEEANGIFSDISIICPAWGIAGVNLSIGYIKEHSNIEMLFVDVMNNTLARVDNILSMGDWPKFKYYTILGEDYLTQGYSYTMPECCNWCGKPIDYDNGEFVRSDGGSLDFVCEDCFFGLIDDGCYDYCTECDTIYVQGPHDHRPGQCVHCREAELVELKKKELKENQRVSKTAFV